MTARKRGVGNGALAVDDGLLKGSVSVPSDILLQELPNQGLIFLNLTTEEYFGLDDVGTDMYETLVACGSVEVAYEKLLADYNVDASVLRRDLTEFVEDLVERGLLEHQPRSPDRT